MWMKDLRQVLRALLRTPGFSAVAVLTLALGIAANVAIFSVVETVLLDPLPYPESDRLVMIWNRWESQGGARQWVAPGDLVDYREQAASFEGLSAVWSGRVSLRDGEEPAQIRLGYAAANLFTLLGVSPVLGRDFVPEDQEFDSEAVNDPTRPAQLTSLILSHRLWQRRYGGDPDILGKIIHLSDRPMEVVGVLPAGFELLLPPDAGVTGEVDAWRPLWIRWNDRDGHWMRVIGRLADGVSLAQARAEMEAIARGQRERLPQRARTGSRIEVRPLHDEVVRHVRPTLLILLASTGLVLLLACANVAHLLLVRGLGREREIAVRTALGAGRWRIVRQVLMESLALAAAAGAVGLFLAAAALDLLLVLDPADVPRLEAAGLDASVVLFAVAVSLLTAALFGLAPARGAFRLDLASALKARSGSGRGSGRGAARRLLMAAEVTVSLVLLLGAGLLLRSFQELRGVDLGYDPSGVLTFDASFVHSLNQKYPSAAERAALMYRFADRIAALPGVEGVGGVWPLPLADGDLPSVAYAAEGSAAGEDRPQASLVTVTPSYFETMKIRLTAGRPFQRHEALPVAIVDRKLALRLWPGANPVGRRIELGSRPLVAEVVGVVDDLRSVSLTADDGETIYAPFEQDDVQRLAFTVRCAVDPMSMAATVRDELLAVESDVPIGNLRMMETYVSEDLAPQRFAMVLLSISASAALVLALVGLYSVLSFQVSRRRHEIGVRMAFGASPDNVVRLVMGQGLAVILAGAAVGALSGLWLTRVLASLLYGVTAADPLTFVLAASLVGTVGLCACFVPAQRASRVDPVAVLRQE